MTEAVRAMEIPVADQRSRGFSAFQTRMKVALWMPHCATRCVSYVWQGSGGWNAIYDSRGCVTSSHGGGARARRAVASFSGDDSMLVQGAASSAHSKTSARDRLRREVRKTTSKKGSCPVVS